MKVFVDMDGVLADYYGGIVRAFTILSPWPYLCRVGDWNFFTGNPLNLTNEQVAPKMGRDFYANLELLPDAHRLIRELENEFDSNVYFLSSPWSTPGCDEGKREWVRRFFPAYEKRTLIGSCKEACAHQGAVLFDDSDGNCKKFRSYDGKAVVIPRPWNSRHAECDHSSGAMLSLDSVVAKPKKLPTIEELEAILNGST